jgi:hypothetical protein
VNWRTPDLWQFVLLALAAFRIYRLGARDTITEPVRAAVTYEDDASVSLDDAPDDEGLTVIGLDDDLPMSLRVYASTLIRCPWCAGFYVSAAVWGAWELWPRPTLFLAAPWALSAAVALAAKNLDR